METYAEQELVAAFSSPGANWIELVRMIRLESFKEGMKYAASLPNKGISCSC